MRLSLLLLVLLVQPAGAQWVAPDRAGHWVDSIFARYDRQDSPGCAVGVMGRGALMYQNGYGLADLERDVPITSSTPFYLASVSKQFTAMAVVLLVQDGRLSLDDDVRRWVPEVPDFGPVITLRHLMQHTSGLRDYFTLLGFTGWPSDGPLTERELLDLVSRQRGLNFAPGEQFLYSNTGYALLSIVVKRASGQSLRDFADRRIFQPLGMRRTEFRDDHTALVRHRALAYQGMPGYYRLSLPGFDIVGDGGLYSTIEDLARWDANFETGRVGGPHALALLQEPGTLNSGERTSYGLALNLGEFRGLRTVFHGGSYGGYRAMYVRFPEQRLAVATLCNVASAPPTLAEQVASVFLSPMLAGRRARGSVPSVQPSGTAGTSSPERLLDSIPAPNEQVWLEGRYYSEELNLPVTLRSREGSLVMHRPRGEEIRFSRSSTDVYTSKDQITLRIERGRIGEVVGFTLTIGRVRELQFLRQ